MKLTGLVRRATWGARSRLSPTVGQHRRVIVHTEAGAPMPATATAAQEQARMRSVDAYHLSLGWSGGFGYLLAFVASGRRYEGRGIRRVGAHTVGHNRELGIVVLGHGDREPMTPACIASIRAAIAAAVESGDLDPNYEVSGHRDHIPPGQKSCPGNRIYPQIAQLRNVHLTPTPPPPAPPSEEDTVLVRIKAEGHNPNTVYERLGGTLYPLTRAQADVQPGWRDRVVEIDGVTAANFTILDSDAGALLGRLSELVTSSGRGKVLSAQAIPFITVNAKDALEDLGYEVSTTRRTGVTRKT